MATNGSDSFVLVVVVTLSLLALIGRHHGDIVHNLGVVDHHRIEPLHIHDSRPRHCALILELIMSLDALVLILNVCSTRVDVHNLTRLLFL